MANQGKSRSGDDVGDDFRWMDTGQFVIQAAVEVRQLAMVESHLVQNRRVQIADVTSVYDGLMAEFIGLAVGHSVFDASTCHPVGKPERVVVAAVGIAGLRN